MSETTEQSLEWRTSCSICKLPFVYRNGVYIEPQYAAVCNYCILAYFDMARNAVKYTWELDDSEVEEVLAGSLVLRLAAETGGLNHDATGD